MARSHLEDQAYDQALKCLFEELDKDPDNYEGNMLLAKVYKETRQPDEALAALNRIIKNPDVMPGQVDWAKEAIADLKLLKRQLEIEAQRNYS